MTRTFGSLGKPNDPKAVEVAYSKYKRLMFAIAGKYTIDSADQEDIVQISLERLVKIFSNQSASKCCISAGYIVYTVRSVAIDFIRKQAREASHYVDIEDNQLAEIAIDNGTLDDLLISSERALRLWSIWPLLNVDDQILLEGKYIFGLLDKELASILKCKPNSIRMKLTRARRRAMTLMSDKENNDEQERTTPRQL